MKATKPITGPNFRFIIKHNVTNIEVLSRFLHSSNHGTYLAMPDACAKRKIIIINHSVRNQLSKENKLILICPRQQQPSPTNLRPGMPFLATYACPFNKWVRSCSNSANDKMPLRLNNLRRINYIPPIL